MIAHGGLIAKHMLHDVGHEKTFGKPEPYQDVEHWTEQSRERCKQVGNGSGPESERHKDRRLVPGLYLTRARSHGTVRCSGFHHGMALHGESLLQRRRRVETGLVAPERIMRAQKRQRIGLEESRDAAEQGRPAAGFDMSAGE
jgi:hypothetical protein